MKTPRELTLTAHGEREIVITRAFDAPRVHVFAAQTRPDLLQRWLLGPPGWTMPVCQVDARVGGSYRMVWRNAEGTEMGVSGEFRQIVPPERIVSTERFDQAWYPGQALRTLELAERDGVTTLTLTVLYESGEARDAALRTGMEQGVAASYNLLAELLASQAGVDAAGLTEPQIVQMTPRTIAVLHLTIPRSEIQTVMGPGLSELRQAIAAQGVAATGPWFSHHLRMEPGIFDFQIGVPVAAPIAPTGRVQPGEWPAGLAARTVYCGSYEGLGAAWGAFDAWVAAAAHAPAPDLWEVYTIDPHSDPDPAAWRTELTRPLLKLSPAAS